MEHMTIYNSSFLSFPLLTASIKVCECERQYHFDREKTASPPPEERKDAGEISSWPGVNLASPVDG